MQFQNDNLKFARRRTQPVHLVKNKGHFTRICIFCRKNLNIVSTQIVDFTDSNYLSDKPDVSMDHVNGKSCGRFNAWSESRQSKNDDSSVLKVTTIFDDDGKELEKNVKYWPQKKKSSSFKHTNGLC